MLLCKIGNNVTIVVRPITLGGIVRSHRKVRVVHVDSRIDEGHKIQSLKINKVLENKVTSNRYMNLEYLLKLW